MAKSIVVTCPGCGYDEIPALMWVLRYRRGGGGRKEAERNAGRVREVFLKDIVDVPTGTSELGRGTDRFRSWETSPSCPVLGAIHPASFSERDYMCYPNHSFLTSTCSSGHLKAHPVSLPTFGYVFTSAVATVAYDERCPSRVAIKRPT